MAEKYAPKVNDRARDLFERADRAAEEIDNMSQEQKDQHFQELEYEIAEVNRHSYKTNIGQAKTLSKYQHVRYKG